MTFSLSLRRLVNGGGSERESFHLYPEGRPLTKLPYSWNSNFYFLKKEVQACLPVHSLLSDSPWKPYQYFI